MMRLSLSSRVAYLDDLHHEGQGEGEGNYDEEDGADDHEVSTDPLTLLTGCTRSVK